MYPSSNIKYNRESDGKVLSDKSEANSNTRPHFVNSEAWLNVNSEHPTEQATLPTFRWLDVPGCGKIEHVVSLGMTSTSLA